MVLDEFQKETRRPLSVPVSGATDSTPRVECYAICECDSQPEMRQDLSVSREVSVKPCFSDKFVTGVRKGTVGKDVSGNIYTISSGEGTNSSPERPRPSNCAKNRTFQADKSLCTPFAPNPRVRGHRDFARLVLT